MHGQRKKQRKGFTLAEMVIASVILCGAVIAVSAISTRSLAGSKLNKEYESAWHFLDRQLTLMDHMGINEFVEQGVMEGQIEDTEPKFNWKVEVLQLEFDNLWQVDITVWWDSQDRRRNVSAGTMLNGQGVLAQLAVE